eukprot:5834-Heterococcus_DN1.PRE.1
MAAVKDEAPCRGFGDIDHLSIDLDTILVARAAAAASRLHSPSHTVGCQSTSTLPSNGSAFHLQDDEELGKPVKKPTKLGCFEKLPKRVQELVTDSDWESLWCGCAFFLLALLLGLSGAFEGTDIRPQAVQRSLCAPCATVDDRLLAQIEADISRVAAL